MNIEKMMIELKQINDKIADQNTPIDETIILYEKAKELIKKIEDFIKSMEGKIEKIAH